MSRLAFAEREGFGDMGVGNFGAVAFEVSDGLGDFDDFEVGTSGKIELFGSGGEEGFGGFG